MKLGWILGGLATGAVAAWAMHTDAGKVEPVSAVVREISGHGLGIGMRPSLGMLKSIDGKALDLAKFASGKPTVFVMTSTTCPIAKKLRPTLNRIEAEWTGKGVQFIEVYPNDTEPASDIRALHSAATSVRDPKGQLQAALRAKTSTEVFVLDGAGTLAYRGAVSDQYGLTTTLPKANHFYLADALDAVTHNQKPTVEATEAPGCALESYAEPKPEKITYFNQVSRLMQKNCVSCHRDGGIAPFKLDNYADVSSRKTMIGFVTKNRQMPPWFADDESGPHSKWRNDAGLTPDEKEWLQQWAESGAPKGDPKTAPKPLTFPKDWRIGTPTAIYQIPQPTQVKADGTMEYVEQYVDPHLTQDEYVTAYQIRPTSGRVVHHVLVFAENREWSKLTGRERLRKQFSEGDAGGLKGFFAGYVPGNDGIIYPTGFAKKLPRDSILHFQIHYTPNGKVTTDQVRIGLVMSPQPPVHEIHTTAVAQLMLNIPPNTEKCVTKGKMKVPFDGHILSFMPHMHLRGSAFKYEITDPAGQTTTLLNIPRYDFNWQLAYSLRDPLEVKAGSWLTATGVYNNSASNPAIKDYNRTVHWGDQTSDEMFLGYLEYYRD